MVITSMNSASSAASVSPLSELRSIEEEAGGALFLGRFAFFFGCPSVYFSSIALDKQSLKTS